jgi:hypothetical protein
MSAAGEVELPDGAASEGAGEHHDTEPSGYAGSPVREGRGRRCG